MAIKFNITAKLLMAAVVCTISACSSSKPTAVAAPQREKDAPAQARYLPKARAYRTSAPCSNLVFVNVADNGTLLSYPDPADITDAARPVELADGWLLDRRGITPNSVFTNITFNEYAAHPSAPSPDELLKSLNRGIRVLEIIELPMRVGEADAANANAAISAGNYTVVYETPRITPQ